MCSQSGTRNLNSDPVAAAVAYFEKYISPANPFYCSEMGLDKGARRAASPSTLGQIKICEVRLRLVCFKVEHRKIAQVLELTKEQGSNSDKSPETDFQTRRCHTLSSGGTKLILSRSSLRPPHSSL